MKLSVTSRQVRNRVDKHVPLDFKKAMQEIAEIILSEAKPMPYYGKRPQRPKAKLPRTHRQLMLFDTSAEPCAAGPAGQGGQSE